MKKKFEKQLVKLTSMEADSEKLSCLTSLLRSILQVAVVTSLETIKEKTPYDEIALDDLIKRFCKPVDGLPLQILDTVIPFLRSYVDPQFLKGWYKKNSRIQAPLNKQLTEWVQFRNKRQGHGVLDAETTSVWALKTENIIKDCLIVFGPIMPTLIENSLWFPRSLGGLYFETPIVYNDSPIVIMNVIEKKGIWKLKGQLLNFDNAEEFTVDLPEGNIFSLRSLKPLQEYDLVGIITNKEESFLFHNIPIRQTDIFEGRDEEIKILHEWMDDEDSRYCLVYGDGGYGKTTLVLEMLNLLLESQFDFEKPLPEIISYHTAKMTKWTESGITHFKGVTPVMDECIRELMRFFFPILSHEWYNVSGRAIIDKAVGVLKSKKYNRDDILLVLDNTETLATTPEEVKELGAFFKSVGKLIGRIIITSRRREFIEATPILVEGLSENESVNLTNRLAKEYNAGPVIQAGEATLKKVSNQLMRKPLLLEGLVKYIARSNASIDSALTNVFKKSNEELLEFLYEDAWARITILQKNVFFVLINLTCPLNQVSVSQACTEVGIQHTDFQNGLTETHFAVSTDYGRTYTIEFVDLANRFFLQEFGKIKQEDKNRLKKIADSVDAYVISRAKIEEEYRSDRVAEAFRSEYAKSAKIYTDKGNIKEAIEMYQLAIEDDPLNSALYDRFAWLLFNKAEKLDGAKSMAEKAVELDPHNCDALVNLAIINYRLGDLFNGDKYIDLAKEFGRPTSFCLLRKAIARYHHASNVQKVDASIALLEKAKEFLDVAERQINYSDSYSFKNRKGISKYKSLTDSKLKSFRAKRTLLISAGKKLT